MIHNSRSVTTRQAPRVDPTEEELDAADRILDELNRRHGTVFDD